jgi:hypothetical protein
MNVLQKWLAVATPEQQRTLARRAKTTVGTLRQIAGGYRTDGKLRASVDLAVRLEKAAASMPEPLAPRLPREAFVDACRTCEYRTRCSS